MLNKDNINYKSNWLYISSWLFHTDLLISYLSFWSFIVTIECYTEKIFSLKLVHYMKHLNTTVVTISYIEEGRIHTGWSLDIIFCFRHGTNPQNCLFMQKQLQGFSFPWFTWWEAGSHAKLFGGFIMGLNSDWRRDHQIYPLFRLNVEFKLMFPGVKVYLTKPSSHSNYIFPQPNQHYIA